MRIHKEAWHDDRFIIGANIRIIMKDYGKHFYRCPDTVELGVSVGEFVECGGVDGFHGVVGAGD